MVATAVIGLVMDAMRKIESRCIVAPSTAMRPTDTTWTAPLARQALQNWIAILRVSAIHAQQLPRV